MVVRRLNTSRIDFGQMTGSKPGLYYGFYIVLAGMLIMACAYGARISFGVFFKPLLTEFGWSSAATSAAFSLSMLMEGAFGFILGGLTDRFGPRLVLTISGVFMCAGYLLMSQVTTLWQLFLYYGVIEGIGVGGVMVPIISVVGRWFVKRRGTMTSIVMTGTGIGALAGSPLSNYLISTYDWRVSYIITGAAILLIVVASAQFMKRDPSKMGLAAFGETANTRAELKSGSIGLSLKDVFATRQFWILICTFFCLATCVFAVSVHIVPALIATGVSRAQAANVLAAVGAMMIFGRLILGVMSDRVGNRRIFIVGFIVMAVSLFWLVPADGLWAFILFAIVFGFFNGGLGSLVAPLTSSLFGMKHHGLVFGFAGFCFTMGAAFGPFLAGSVFDTTGSYKSAFFILAVISLAGMAFAIFLKPTKVSTSTI
jgi:MFS family permease